MQSFGSEERDQPLAVSGEGRIRVACLGVTFDLGHGFVDRALPFDLAGLLVERVDPPFVLGIVLDRCDIAIQPDLEAGILLPADRGRHEHLVAPDHRARQAKSGDRRLPGHVGAGGRIPGRGQRKAFSDTQRGNTAELRPVYARPRRRCGSDGSRRDRTGRGERTHDDYGTDDKWQPTHVDLVRVRIDGPNRTSARGRCEMPVSRRLLQTTVPQHAAPAATIMFRDFGTHRNSSGASPWRSEAGSSTVKIANVPEGGGLQQVSLALAAQRSRHTPSQFVVDEWHELLTRVEVALVPCMEERRDVGGHRLQVGSRILSPGSGQSSQKAPRSCVRPGDRKGPESQSGSSVM